MPIDSNDNYIHKVSENASFIFVDFVDLKIFKFKSRKLFLGHPVYFEIDQTLPHKLQN